MGNREKGGNAPETNEENEKDETLQKLEASLLESKVNTVSDYAVCFQMLVSQWFLLKLCVGRNFISKT